MKRLYYIATLAIALFASLPIQAQEEAGNTQQQQQRRRGPEASRGAREEEKKENGNGVKQISVLKTDTMPGLIN